MLLAWPGVQQGSAVQIRDILTIAAILLIFYLKSNELLMR